MAEGSALPFFYRLACPQGHEELAELELRALTGGAADDPIAWAHVGADITRAAFVAEGARLLAQGTSHEGMMAAAAKLGMCAERFRVSAHKFGGKFGPPSQAIEKAIADIIEGRPDLSRPAREFIVIACPDLWLLGELLSRYDKSWSGHDQRPCQYSSALPSRFARALVNLVVRPGDRLLDPCCGVGTVLVEAATVGARAFGWDLNPALVFHAQENLRYHRMQAALICGDGRQATGRFDGAVLDLPYGHSSRKDDASCCELIEHAAQCTRLMAASMTEFLEDLGLQLLGTARVPKQRLVRHVHWVRSDNLNDADPAQRC